MSVTTSHSGRRHLAVVTDDAEYITVTPSPEMRRAVLAAAGLPDLTAGELIPAPVLERLEDLDALHGTACDTYDIATRELEAARDALTEAAWALTEAEETWSKAGAKMDEAARTVSAAREAAGVKLTASGYLPVVTL